ncbi:metalloregulator ArsR/SmtB family transcription factor [Nonomuraea sp. NPDC003709]|uniref:ArsR/SmtB family transcription factor n=1 Tax=Nonomuraea sp. NPDC003709 TaxID=3154450 RepID=UPI0033A5C31B
MYQDEITAASPNVPGHDDDCPPVSLIAEPLERAQAEQLAGALKAVADPTRLQLLSMISGSPTGEACVCDLTAPLGLTQPTVSHHLKILVDAGLLSREKRGKWAWFTIVPEKLAVLRGLIP